MFESTLDHSKSVVNEAALINSETTPFYIVDLIKDQIDAKLQDLNSNLKDIGLRDFETMIIGSLACGLYDKPKPREYSLNPQCPKNFKEVIECDLRVLVPENVDVFDEVNIELFERAVEANPEATVLAIIEGRFNQRVDTTRVYSYQELLPNLGLEFEVCFNRRPYYEIAKAWHIVFTPDEIQRQKELRIAGRDVLHLDYGTDFTAIKSLQTRECRHRILANYWLQKNAPDILAKGQFPFEPLTEPCPVFLKKIINEWDKNYAVDPARIPRIPETIVRKFRAHHIGDLLVPPQAPLWLTVAESLRKR